MTAKILLFDIETAPSIVYAWGRWKVNVAPSQVIQEGFIMTWAAKWLDSDEYYCDALPYHKKEYKADPTNDKPVVESLKALIDDGVQEGDVAKHQSASMISEMVLNSFFGIMLSWISVDNYPLRTHAAAAGRFIAQAISND